MATTSSQGTSRTSLAILASVLLAVLCVLLYLGLADTPLEKRPVGKEGAALTEEALSRADARAGFPAAETSPSIQPGRQTGAADPAVEIPQQVEPDPYAAASADQQ